MMIQYMSITSDGVDVAEYYKNCGTYISEIAKRSGVCRGTVTHVIAGCAQESSSQAIFKVLEQKIMRYISRTLLHVRLRQRISAKI